MTVAVRIGVLKLADSAPVIMARQQGLFAQYGLEAEIVVSPSWANIADGLAWNRLDAAVMFAPLAMMTALGRRGPDTMLRPLGRVSRGGNTIMLRGSAPVRAVWQAGLAGRQAFDVWRAALGRKPRLAVVHMYSTHLLILRRFLESIEVEMEKETDLCVMPPTDMIHALSEKKIDGCCVGPPWGPEAELLGLAFQVGGSATVLPNHIEKILVTSGKFSLAEDVVHRVSRAVEDALSFCQQPEQAENIARILALPVSEGGLTLPVGATRAILPGGGASDVITFTGGSLQLSDLDWIMKDMMALGWLEEAGRKTLTRLFGSGAAETTHA